MTRDGAGVLLHYHGIGSCWDRRSREDAHGIAGGDCRPGDYAGGEAGGDAELDRILVGGVRHICGAQGITVHGGVIEGWEIDRSEAVPDNEPSVREGERDKFGGETFDRGEDTLQGFVEIEHGFKIYLKVLRGSVDRELTITKGAEFDCY
jgi:hypothetical protein